MNYEKDDKKSKFHMSKYEARYELCEISLPQSMLSEDMKQKNYKPELQLKLQTLNKILCK